MIFITEILLRGVSAITTSTLSVVNPIVGVIISSFTAMLTSIAILITNECISKIKIRYTQLGDWFNVIALLYQKALKQPMVDKKIHEKEANELKKVYNRFLDERPHIMKNTQLKVEDVSGDVIGKDSISLEQMTEMNNFSSQNNVNFGFSLKFNLFTPRK